MQSPFPKTPPVLYHTCHASICFVRSHISQQIIGYSPTRNVNIHSVYSVDDWHRNWSIWGYQNPFIYLLSTPLLTSQIIPITTCLYIYISGEVFIIAYCIYASTTQSMQATSSWSMLNIHLLPANQWDCRWPLSTPQRLPTSWGKQWPYALIQLCQATTICSSRMQRCPRTIQMTLLGMVINGTAAGKYAKITCRIRVGNCNWHAHVPTMQLNFSSCFSYSWVSYINYFSPHKVELVHRCGQAGPISGCRKSLGTVKTLYSTCIAACYSLTCHWPHFGNCYS